MRPAVTAGRIVFRFGFQKRHSERECIGSGDPFRVIHQDTGEEEITELNAEHAHLGSG